MSGFINWLVDDLYRSHLKKLRLFETAAYIAKYRIFPFVRGNGVERYADPSWSSGKLKRDSISIALIADEMTAKNFDALGDGFFITELTPHNWRSMLEREQPEIFFCESAWHGKNGCWDYRIHRNKRLLIDNRIALKHILRYCKAAGIPTIFWNKEDPTFFDDTVNSFSDTALLFDRIFTTDNSCIPRYQALGHDAEVLMFGFSPKYYYPIPLNSGKERAAFFGGWYADQPKRCEDMRRLFDFVLGRGLELIIYDRYFGTDESKNIFPPEYRKYIRPAVPYTQIRDELADIAYVLNVSTVTDSETMFARRVFEAMACGRIVISNESIGLRKIFGDGIWFAGENFDISRYNEIAERNLKLVFENYTFSAQLIAALDKAII